MARTLSLHHLTTLDIGPSEFVSIAAELGCSTVALFTHGDAAGFPMVTDANVTAVAAQLRSSAVEVHTVEYVGLGPQINWVEIQAGFVRSARLGARRMTVHCFDIEEERALSHFARLCGLAADQGMRIGLEWTAVNPAMASLAAANAFLDRAGQSNADLAVDLLHLTRGGDTPTDLAALPAGRIGYAQISDGPGQRDLTEYAERELLVERAPPGDGELPVAQFIAALPSDIVVDVEAPQSAARLAGVSALERARRAVEAARRFLP